MCVAFYIVQRFCYLSSHDEAIVTLEPATRSGDLWGYSHPVYHFVLVYDLHIQRSQRLQSVLDKESFLGANLHPVSNPYNSQGAILCPNRLMEKIRELRELGTPVLH